MTRPGKKRLDLLLVERGLFDSRTKAQAALMAGKVEVPGRPRPKAGDLVDEGAELVLLEDAVPFVSRGGLKLQSALERFALQCAGRVAADIGASTGGFTDCLLQHGALKVFAVDVGRGQLDARLRADPRVVNMEKTHASRLPPDAFGASAGRPDLAVVDVSFISATKVLPALLACLKRPCELVVLVKPQFELEPKKVPKGVVRKDEHRQEALARVRAVCAELRLEERGCMDCPVKGPKGNVEFLLYLCRE
ncbi:MAG: TlyA family RNA methyltransferase [Elusimicrobiota bacterium]|jgi:23S rRNA (cytidine1920-2'-O)/16S rRNA (cytidine1409-2'-O)-methyltransferase